MRTNQFSGLLRQVATRGTLLCSTLVENNCIHSGVAANFWPWWLLIQKRRKRLLIDKMSVSLKLFESNFTAKASMWLQLGYKPSAKLRNDTLCCSGTKDQTECMLEP